jgi:NADPH:quinone reductase-like Zn-dependent oxidoreductase
MQLIQFTAPGPPGVLKCLDVPMPEPKAGEVLIRAHAIGVGIPDTLIRAGTYGHMPPLPATPGTEMSGVIEKPARLHQRARAAPARRPLCRLRRDAGRGDVHFA